MTNTDNNETGGPRFTIPLWAWAAALAALLFFAFTIWQAQKLQRQLTELQSQMRVEQGRKQALEAQRQEIDQIRALLAAPETRTVQLKAAGGVAPPFKIFWNEQMGVLVTAQSVPAIPADRAFQLWVLPKQGSPVSAGVFQPEANGSILKLIRVAAPFRIKETAALMVTVEPRGGSAQPTTKPAWVGPIT